MTGAKSEEPYDLVVLSAGLEGSKGTQDIARVAGVQTAAAGFIREFHPKLAPVDTQRTGMFLCGTAQGPKTIPESIAQAKAAAARAISMLSTGFAMTPAQVASSDVDVCVACGVCETACPQTAITITVGRRRALVRRPQHLPRLRHLRRRVPHGGDAARRLQRRRGAGGGDGLMTASARRHRRGRGTSADRTIVAFCCRECAYAAADASANARTPLPPTVRLVLMPCTGRVSPLHLLSALAEGADGVMVAGCLLGQCHYREGNFNAVDRVAFVQRLLKSVGVEPERCRMFTMSAGEPPKFVAAVREMDRVIGGLPPLPRSDAPAAAGRAAPRRGRGGPPDAAHPPRTRDPRAACPAARCRAPSASAARSSATKSSASAAAPAPGTAPAAPPSAATSST